ncbi:Fructose-1-phosphate phosphatase YqaB [Ephemeroptericola cinctiostellae]|uniref:Fructose-1-phosphate phosphatase YqaB n=1 Tax=Ephemeroptericola cinctiostellae TaxID=2268024 RepID=A0A345DAC9_9BURK|nr:HAD-IA family hydrolase [Ephemeroptericola cinctiostellae]AXF85317.1 Fructose-1-phosphate phosphatase YqaB [Ephemeroptericola cinctiostellae]
MAGYTTLISDCDGVLIDSEVVAHEVLVRETQAVFSNVNCNAFLISSFGQKTEELVRQVAQFSGRSIPDDFLKHLRTVTDAAIEQHAFPVKHVEILVNHPRLKAVASNSGMARIVSAISKVGLDARSDVKILSADQVKQPKPAPDLYLLAAHEMGLEPAECVVIEDSTSGVLAALAAGMGVIGFVGGLHIPMHHAADLREMGVLTVFDSMQYLPQVLSRSVGWGN